jgi:anti-sigma B factor antagonist
MTIVTYEVGPVVVIKISGKLKYRDGEGQLREKVQNLLIGGKKQFLVNLSALTDADSSCIGELVSCLSDAKRAGGSLKLLSPSKKIQDRLAMTHLLNVFEVYEDESAGVNSF